MKTDWLANQLWQRRRWNEAAYNSVFVGFGGPIKIVFTQHAYATTNKNTKYDDDDGTCQLCMHFMFHLVKSHHTSQLDNNLVSVFVWYGWHRNNIHPTLCDMMRIRSMQSILCTNTFIRRSDPTLFTEKITALKDPSWLSYLLLSMSMQLRSLTEGITCIFH